MLRTLSFLLFLTAPAVLLGQSAAQDDSPTVLIGGRDVAAIAAALQAPTDAVTIPEALDTSHYRPFVRNRRYIQLFDHNPSQGKSMAPLQIVEFSDLACLECTSDLERANQALEPYKDYIYYRHVHAPKSTGSPNQLASFYGKIAQKMGRFWDYKERIKVLETTTADGYFNVLSQLGYDEKELRRSAIHDARTFYTQLDADTRLFNKLKLDFGPAWLVNGMLIHSAAIDPNLIKQVLSYEAERLKLPIEGLSLPETKSETTVEEN